MTRIFMKIISLNDQYILQINHFDASLPSIAEKPSKNLILSLELSFKSEN